VNEAQKIEQRMVARIVEAIHAGQYAVKGHIGPDLRPVTIPANLITAERLLPLHSDELTVGDARYASDMRYFGIELHRALDNITEPPPLVDPPQQRPKTQPLAQNKGGSPGVWDWEDVLARLKQEHRSFQTRTNFQEWLRNNVRRSDARPRGDGPEMRTVRQAIRRYKLDKFAIFSDQR
jgi:hypothetical protein